MGDISSSISRATDTIGPVSLVFEKFADVEPKPESESGILVAMNPRAPQRLDWRDGVYIPKIIGYMNTIRNSVHDYL